MRKYFVKIYISLQLHPVANFVTFDSCFGDSRSRARFTWFPVSKSRKDRLEFVTLWIALWDFVNAGILKQY